MTWLSDLVCWVGCQTGTCPVLDLLQPALQNRIGAWAIIALLAGVWAILFYVAYTVWRIARAGDDRPVLLDPRSQPYWILRCPCSLHRGFLPHYYGPPPEPTKPGRFCYTCRRYGEHLEGCHNG